MPDALVSLVTPVDPPAPVIFDMALPELPALPPVVDLTLPTPHTAALYVGNDLASVSYLGSMGNFFYNTIGNQTATGYQNQLMGSWNNINYPITTAATN